MSEPMCITKAREHCGKFAALPLNDTSTVFHYDGNGKLWRVSQLLAEYDLIKQRAEAAEAWRDRWSEHLLSLRTECEALRTVDDAMVGRFLRAYAECEGEPQTFTHRMGVRAALTAALSALAVQPTKYKLPFIAHEKCYDFNSCARNQRCMYGKIGATGKWDNCFTPTSPALAVQPTTGDTNE